MSEKEPTISTPCPDCAHLGDDAGFYVGLEGRETCQTCGGTKVAPTGPDVVEGSIESLTINGVDMPLISGPGVAKRDLRVGDPVFEDDIVRGMNDPIGLIRIPTTPRFTAEVSSADPDTVEVQDHRHHAVYMFHAGTGTVDMWKKDGPDGRLEYVRSMSHQDASREAREAARKVWPRRWDQRPDKIADPECRWTVEWSRESPNAVIVKNTKNGLAYQFRRGGNLIERYTLDEDGELGPFDRDVPIETILPFIVNAAIAVLDAAKVERP